MMMDSESLWDAAVSKEIVTIFAAVALKNGSQIGAVGGSLWHLPLTKYFPDGHKERHLPSPGWG